MLISFSFVCCCICIQGGREARKSERPQVVRARQFVRQASNSFSFRRGVPTTTGVVVNNNAGAGGVVTTTGVVVNATPVPSTTAVQIEMTG